MRTPVILLMLLMAGNLFAGEKCSAIKIVEATSQSWVAGAPGGRSGIKYSIKIQLCSDKKVEFTNLWIGHDNVEFDKEYFNQGTNVALKKGDSLLLTSNRINGDTALRADAKRLPIDYKGVALIECTVNGAAHYYIVKHFKEVAGLQGQ